MTQLMLDGTKVTLEGLKQLAAEPKLKSLNVSQSGLTKAEVRAHRELLPDCRVDSEHGATEPKTPHEGRPN